MIQVQKSVFGFSQVNRAPLLTSTCRNKVRLINRQSEELRYIPLFITPSIYLDITRKTRNTKHLVKLTENNQTTNLILKLVDMIISLNVKDIALFVIRMIVTLCFVVPSILLLEMPFSVDKIVDIESRILRVELMSSTDYFINIQFKSFSSSAVLTYQTIYYQSSFIIFIFLTTCSAFALLYHFYDHAKKLVV